MSERPPKKDFSRWYDYVLKEGGFIDVRYGVKGMIVYRERGMDVIDRLYSIFEAKLKERGHKKVLMPLFIPLNAFRKESEHIKGFESEVFKVTQAGDETLDEPLIVRPTSETAFYPMFALWVKSYRDLPFRTYQSVAVYRYETKATRPLFRGREFLWIETHNLFRTEEEAMEHIKGDIDMVGEVFKRIGLPYMVIRREAFDRFPGAKESFAYDTVLPTGEVLQVATTHYLGTNFTAPFEVKYLDQDGNLKYPFSTTLGIGMSRILGATIAVHGDDYGAFVPPLLAEPLGIIVPIYGQGKRDGLEGYIDEVSKKLESLRFVVDLSEMTPGEKYYTSELLGYPLRIEIGEKEMEARVVTVFRRDLRRRYRFRLDEAFEGINGLISEINARLSSVSQLKVSELNEAGNRDEVMKLAAEGKPFKMSFCGREECAKDLKSATGGFEVRGEPVYDKEKAGSVCSWCGEPAVRKVIVARAY